MGIFDTMFGRDEAPQPRPAGLSRAGTAPSADEQALARYRYMLKTAPPETIEQAHAEAFAQLTQEQRSLLRQQLSADLPDAERGAAAMRSGDDPHSLARLATRAEVRRPGTMERALGGMADRGTGVGGMVAGSLLAGIAGVVIGSAIAQSFFGDADNGDAAAGEDISADAGDTGDDGGEDFWEV
jgi:hypothetical protein